MTHASERGLTTFSYKALRSDGRKERGQLTAADQSAALLTLADRGLFATEVIEQEPTEAMWTSRLSASDLALGLRVLATLLDSGLPIGRVSYVFGTIAPASWKRVINVLQPALRDGRSLSAGLEESRIHIPQVMIGIIRAGESGGGLVPALRTAAELAESSAATRSAIRSALAYPAVLAITGSVSAVVLVGAVLPRFSRLLIDIGQPLPPTTKLVLDAAEIVRATFPIAVLTSILGFALLSIWKNGEAGRRAFDATLLRLPVVGGLRHASATSRACAALSALLETGVPIATALTHSAKAAGDAAVAARMLEARKSIIAGRALASALDEHNTFTNSSLRLLRAGEETGRLPAMLSHAARLERERAIEGVRRLVRLLEPCLILLFAGLVATVAAALLQAVYSVRPI